MFHDFKINLIIESGQIYNLCQCELHLISIFSLQKVKTQLITERFFYLYLKRLKKNRTLCEHSVGLL